MGNPIRIVRTDVVGSEKVGSTEKNGGWSLGIKGGYVCSGPRRELGTGRSVPVKSTRMGGIMLGAKGKLNRF